MTVGSLVRLKEGFAFYAELVGITPPDKILRILKEDTDPLTEDCVWYYLEGVAVSLPTSILELVEEDFY